MPDIIRERMTAQVDGEFVVFLIGMRINRLWKVHKWLPVVMAMPRMLRELEADPDSGLLGFQSWFGNPNVFVQYWRSFEHLERYAKDAAHAHRPAWAMFNRTVGQQRRRRHLARDLSRASGRLRVRLQQHAAVRPGGCDRKCSGFRPS